MDDLIVIILTLVFAVVGALGQIRKKKQPEPVAENSSDTEDFWDMLGADEEKTEPAMNEEIKQQYNQTVPETGLITEDRSISYYIKQNKKSIFEENIDREDQEQKSITKNKDRFSLRKAVIYSEILNRKYT